MLLAQVHVNMSSDGSMVLTAARKLWVRNRIQDLPVLSLHGVPTMWTDTHWAECVAGCLPPSVCSPRDEPPEDEDAQTASVQVFTHSYKRLSFI